MTHDYYLEVRGSELDSFGHVNNAVYISYLEECRWKFFDEMNWLGYLKKEGIFPVVVETNIRYIRELKMLDKVVIKTHWRTEGEYMITDHTIYIAGTSKKVAKAVGKMIFVSIDRVVHELPDFIKNTINSEENTA
ncbi:MAG: acyl-CoA thioesterase [Clostridia bacterium]|nr:acyl-CoA thioesterase [Clostridia bacterium]